jgi:hypothetical protein
MTIHLVQEIKRDIIYRRMNTNVNQQGRNPTRIRAHLLSTIKFLEYNLESYWRKEPIGNKSSDSEKMGKPT